MRGNPGESAGVGRSGGNNVSLAHLMMQARTLTGNLLSMQGVCGCGIDATEPLANHHCAPGILLLAIQQLIAEAENAPTGNKFAVFVDSDQAVVSNVNLASIRTRQVNWSFSSDSKRARITSNDSTKRKGEPSCFEGQNNSSSCNMPGNVLSDPTAGGSTASGGFADAGAAGDQAQKRARTSSSGAAASSSNVPPSVSNQEQPSPSAESQEGGGVVTMVMAKL